MWGLSGEEHCVEAFPEISEALQSRFSIGELCLRPFGILYEDLEINFDLMPRPVLETQIVQRCTEANASALPEEDFFWSLDVGTRSRCLLTIAALEEDHDHITLDLRCQNPVCRQEIEVELSISKLRHRDQQNGPIKVHIGNEESLFRRPNGKDQLYWLNQSYDSVSAAVRSMAETLAIGRLPEALEKSNPDDNDEDPMLEIGKALKSSDPLTCFGLRVRCPDCGREDVHFLDLGEWALNKLRRQQDRLIDAIHILAYRYHWTEEQIVTIPLWRRSRYLARIEKEEAR